MMAVTMERQQACSTTAGADARRCLHCGEPCTVVVVDERGNGFCCAGCQGAYAVISGLGLQDFYALRQHSRRWGECQPPQPSDAYEPFDSPEFLGNSAPRMIGDGVCESRLGVAGLHCSACAWLIENALRRVPGILAAEVNLRRHTLTVQWESSRTTLSHLACLLDRLGYSLHPLNDQRWQELDREGRRLLAHIAMAGFLAANAMWIAVALYAADFTGIDPRHRYFLNLAGMALAAAAVWWPGRRFLVGAVAALRTGTPHMDLPIAVGLSMGTVVGGVHAVRGEGAVYFDSLSSLVFLLLLGRWLQHHQQQRTSQAIDLLLRLTPMHATVIRTDGTRRQVLADRLAPGDRICVLPDQSIPVDGRIVAGQSEVDRSLMTGESDPVVVQEGDRVSAGEINLGHEIEVHVEAVGQQTRVGQILQSIDAAASQRAPIVLLADRMGGIFVLTVLALAAATLVYWWNEDRHAAVEHATALLIVACPCALALATPLALALAVGRAARGRLFIRDANVLQQLCRPGQMWFDKTGTLTRGKRRVARMEGAIQWLVPTAALQQHCQHTVAAAIVEEVRRRGWAIPAVERLEPKQPGGMAGTVSGLRIACGSREYLLSQGIDLDDRWQERAERFVDEGMSPVYVAVEGKIELLIGLADALRPEARDVVIALQQRGWQVGILSGDHPRIVHQVARRMQIDPHHALGAATPEDKVEIVRRSSSMHTVVMVGDGANDAAALAAADVGIAVRGGAQASLVAAPVYVGTDDLRSILFLIDGARATHRLIYRTFGIALGYNALAIALAFIGWITPLVAALMMPLSSLSVVGGTILSRHFRSTFQLVQGGG
ncbi:MAG: copper-translocating P-type ATPase [Pirellulaceae bacterium]|nr:MAG: copper-translocating P-type ATPase [Pirellulaceae bacterium]